jgi:hypothetical protein
VIIFICGNLITKTTLLLRLLLVQHHCVLMTGIMVHVPKAWPPYKSCGPKQGSSSGLINDLRKMVHMTSHTTQVKPTQYPSTFPVASSPGMSTETFSQLLRKEDVQWWSIWWKNNAGEDPITSISIFKRCNSLLTMAHLALVLFLLQPHPSHCSLNTPEWSLQLHAFYLSYTFPAFP